MRLALAVAMLVGAGGSARAQDAFEIQVYDADTAAPGDAGMETHLNYDALGVRARSSAGELPTHQVTHLTFEPHIGLAAWCEAGAYFQTALRPDGQFDYAGVKLRFKARLGRRWHDRIGLALNVEWSSIPAAYEAARLGFELRPIVDLRWDRFWVSINPIIDIDAAGRQAGWPQLQPAATATVRVAGPLDLGVEYYSAFGPLNQLAGASSEVHRLFAVGDLIFRRWALQLGAGYGFAAGERLIVKSIVTLDFGGG
jgi:hypothetical protein